MVLLFALRFLVSSIYKWQGSVDTLLLKTNSWGAFEWCAQKCLFSLARQIYPRSNLKKTTGGPKERLLIRWCKCWSVAPKIKKKYQDHKPKWSRSVCGHKSNSFLKYSKIMIWNSQIKKNNHQRSRCFLLWAALHLPSCSEERTKASKGSKTALEGLWRLSAKQWCNQVLFGWFI